MAIEVSIIIINYNQEDLTKSCVESILRRTISTQYEIIVVDNASLTGNIKQTMSAFPNVKLLKSESNLGFARGNNLGISVSSGDYILLLNNDTVLINEAIDLAYNKISNDPTIGVLSSALVGRNEKYQYPAERFPSVKRELQELFRLNKGMSKHEKDKYYLGSAHDPSIEIDCDWVWGTFFMFSRDLLFEMPAKKLPDTFFMYAEDLQWCWIVKGLGYRILYYPKAIVLHYGAASDQESLNEIERYYKKVLPNQFYCIGLFQGYCYSWILFFIKACHLLTLRTKIDLGKAKMLFKFLIKKKKYNLNK